MISQITVPRPHCDSRAVAHRVLRTSPSVQSNDLQLVPDSVAGLGRSPKYSPAEWFSNYQTILGRAGADNLEAESIQQLSRTLNRDSEGLTVQTQAEGTRLLGERLQEIHHCRSELQRHIEQLQADTEALQAARTRLERALEATDTPYAIATDNLNCRARRPGPDLVQDSVEEELLKEVGLIRNVQALLKRTITQVASQIRRNVDAKQVLEMDWSDKQQAYRLDERSGGHSNRSPDTQLHPSSAATQEQVCNPTTWTKFTQDNLLQAAQEEEASSRLRVLVEEMLRETTEDLISQRSTVDGAFSQRCHELLEAKTELQTRLTQVLQQIGEQEKNIVGLQKAIHLKEAPLRVVQSRLHLRSLRPNMELCRDPAQLSLEAEAAQIQTTLNSLKQKLSEARSSLSNLEESRMELQKDISCKNHSLFIEGEKCMTQRQRLPPSSRLSGY
ncbi:tektin-4 [Oryzias melastigma]|uniref:Tektin n=1 Tax=Oryzias melastigma TaxID=30732 RepID=A0A3B3BSF5_ORYME|nr:tektin-4 [Oryzias melastigma]